MRQSQDTGGEKVGGDIPLSEESIWLNKKVMFALFVFVILLVAVSFGSLIGIAVFRKSTKETAPAQPLKKAAVSVPVHKQISSTAISVQQGSLESKSDEKKAPEIKRHGKKTAKALKRSVRVQAAYISSESLEKTLQAAKAGDAEAQYRLGSLYAKGIGVKKDMGEASRWYRRAAGQGHEKARDALEYIYE